TAIARKKGDDICVLVKAGAFRGDVVRHNQIGVLGGKFLSSIFRNALRFRGETNDNLLAFVLREFRKNVGGRLKRDRQRSIAFLNLFGAALDGPVIRHRRGKNDHRRFGGSIQDRPTHFLRGAHVRAFDTRRSFQVHRAADQNHLRAALRSSLGNGITHFPGRAVGEEANGIEVFASRACGNQNRFAIQIPVRFCDFVYSRKNFFQAREPARPGHAARQIALIGLRYFYAACPQRRDIFLGGRVIPHVHIHRRSDDYWRGAGQVQRGEKIIGDATGEFRHDVGGGRRYQKKIRALRDRYFLRLLPSLSSSTEVASGTSNSSNPCSSSSQASRVAFCVLGFSINGGAPAIICRARLAASTTYANWLSGAFVCTVINSSPQTMPEVFVPGPGGARWCSAKRLQSPEPRVPRAPRPHSPRKNHNTCLKRRSHRAPWQAAAQFL